MKKAVDFFRWVGYSISTMKTFKYIVINKNDMTKLAHFATVERVASYLLGRKIKNILVIIDEKMVVNVGDISTNCILKIQKHLEQIG